MDFESLQLLLDIAETGSFSKTAERFFLTQSAVSQRVRSLEASLGHRLIERGKGRPRATLTEAGVRARIAAREILARADSLHRELAELSGSVAGTLNVATVYSIGLHALTDSLTRYLADYPLVNLHLEYLRTDRIYDAILDGTIDCGIVACPRERAGIDVMALGDETMVAIVSPRHALAARPSIPLALLDREPFVAFDPDIPTRRLIDARLERDGVGVRVIQNFDNIETIKRVVEIGLGVSLVPEPTVRREVRDGTLVALAIDGEPLSRPTGVLLRKGVAHSRALTHFLDALGR